MTLLCDPAAERAILSSIFEHGGDAFFEICDIVTHDTFTIDSNNYIFSCMEHLFQENTSAKVDIASIYSTAETLGTTHLLKKKAEQEHLEAIRDFSTGMENIRQFATKIRKLEITRLLRKKLEHGMDRLLEIRGTEAVSEILSIPEDLIFNFGSSLDQSSDEPELIGKGLRERIEDRIANPVDQLGISTGLPNFDKCIGGGLLEGGVTVVGGRQKSGKSMLGNQIGHNLALRNIPVLNLDTELMKVDHENRTLANMSYPDRDLRITINEIKTGKYFDNYQKVESVLKNIDKIDVSEKYPYYHKSIAGKSFDEQLSIMRRWIVTKVGLRDDGTAKDCLIIYDYLKLMDQRDISGNAHEHQILGFMMTQLHNFAVKYKLPVFALVQLNRDGIDREDSSAVAGSDRIAGLCTSLSYFKSKTPDEKAEDGMEFGNKKIVTVFARHDGGLAFGDYINIDFHGDYGRIEELGTKKKPKAQSGPTIEGEVIHFDGRDTEDSD